MTKISQWVHYEEIISWYLRVVYEVTFRGIFVLFTRICFRGNYEETKRPPYVETLHGHYDEMFTCNLRGIVFVVITRKYSELLTWKYYVVVTTKCLLLLYDKIFTPLIYEELAKKYELRRTINYETSFLAYFS